MITENSRKKLKNLEAENSELRETVNKRNEQILSPYELKRLITTITEELKVNLEHNFGSLTDKINRLDLKLETLSKNKTEKNIPIKNLKTSSMENKQTLIKNNTGSPKQLNTESTKQSVSTIKENISNKNNLSSLEEHQRRVMKEIINLENKNSETKNGNASNTYAQVAQKPKNNAEDVKQKPKRRRNIYIGKGDISEDDTFTGRDEKNKKVWIFISRVSDKVKEDDITKYIKRKANIQQNEDLIVKHIPTRIENERPNSKCFQVGIRYDLMDTVYHQKFWPANVAFQRFKFKNRKWEEKSTPNENKAVFLE